MEDAFTLLGRAVELLPEDVVHEGVTVADVREEIRLQDWELALDLLVEIADVHPVSARCWEFLAEAARQMMLDRSSRWCEWRAGEVRYGTVRARLSLLEADGGGRRTAFSGDGRLRPLWDIGHRAPDGERALNVATLWAEGVEVLGPGETANVRLAPLSPERWRHVRVGDVITMHEGAPVVGTATVVDVLPPRS